MTRSFCMIQELLERFWGLAGDFLRGGRKKQLARQVKRWVRDEEDMVVFSYILGVLLLLCCVCLVWTLSNISALRALISQGVIFSSTRHMKVQSARSHIYDEAISGLEPTHCAPGLPLVSIMLLPSLRGVNVGKITWKVLCFNTSITLSSSSQPPSSS